MEYWIAIWSKICKVHNVILAGLKIILFLPCLPNLLKHLLLIHFIVRIDNLLFPFAARLVKHLTPSSIIAKYDVGCGEFDS